ncbi:MAG: hypothetical protein AAF125_07425, partial [Chloroflexota bacterium]
MPKTVCGWRWQAATLQVYGIWGRRWWTDAQTSVWTSGRPSTNALETGNAKHKSVLSGKLCCVTCCYSEAAMRGQPTTQIASRYEVLDSLGQGGMG